MLIATSIYMLVAVGAIGAISYTVLAESAEPLAFVLRALDHPAAASAVALAAIVALPSVILVMMYGQSRIFFVISRDGLLPLGEQGIAADRLASAHHRPHRPVRGGPRGLSYGRAPGRE